MATLSSNIGRNPTQAVSTDFGDIMNEGLSRLERNQQTQRLEEEKRLKREQEFEDRYGIDESLYVLPDTEFRTVNDATTEAVSLYRDRYYDIYKELKKDPNNIELKKKLGNVTNSVKRMKASHEKMKEIGENYLTMLENDELSGVDEDKWREILEATDEGRLKINLDQEDNMQLLFYNKGGALQEVVPYSELIKGSLTKRVDLNKELDALVKRVGTDKIDTVTGGYIQSLNQFGPDQKAFIEGQFDSFLGTDEKSLETNPVLADLLNQATGGSSKKRENFTEEERQFVKRYLVEQTKARFNEEISLEPLPQRAERAQTAAERDALTPDKINIAMDGTAPRKDIRGNFVFTLSQPIAIDPTKSDRKIDVIKSSPSGKITVEGQDRIKIKGVQEGDTVEDVAEREGVQPSLIEQLFDQEGQVTYYRIQPFVEDAGTTINKIGNMFGVNDENGLRNVLYQDMVSKFGKEVADSLITTAPKPNKIEIPKEVKSQSGATYK